ncbi:MAG: hypothetical protein LAT67_08825 [Balneolales bacterium]|nr:hypothetical protein [Balneolales bacterium]
MLFYLRYDERRLFKTTLLPVFFLDTKTEGFSKLSQSSPNSPHFAHLIIPNLV